MSKVVLRLSLFGVMILFLFGLMAPDSPVVWLASTSMNYAWLRLGMILILAILIVTNPPRDPLLRSVMGSLSIIAAGWVLYETYHNHMQILDTLAILEVSVLTSLDVLERDGSQSQTEAESTT